MEVIIMVGGRGTRLQSSKKVERYYFIIQILYLATNNHVEMLVIDWDLPAIVCIMLVE